MDKYILIKEYPCSLKKGSEVFWNGMQYEHLKNHDQAGVARIFPKEAIENSPEYWRKVEKKEYEVIQLKSQSGAILTFNSDGKCIQRNDTMSTNSTPDLMGCFEHKCTIHQIKRKDGEIFTVGDTVECVGRIFKLTEFTVINGDLMTADSDGVSFFVTEPSFKKNHSPVLFVSTDNYEVREGQGVYILDGLFKITKRNAFSGQNIHKVFATRENAEYYVEMNKPRFSKNDVVEAYEKAAPTNSPLFLTFIRNLEDVIESKYYTPQIEEFYVGFQFEILNHKDFFYIPHLPELSWNNGSMDIFGILGEMPNIFKLIEDKQIRVKQLDEDDIISLGFEKFNKDSCVGYSDYILSSIDPNMPFYNGASIHFSKLDDFHRIYLHRYVGNGFDVDHLVSSGDSMLVFYGKIKNKSELKRLLVQLGISES